MGHLGQLRQSVALVCANATAPTLLGHTLMHCPGMTRPTIKIVQKRLHLLASIYREAKYYTGLPRQRSK